MRLGNQVQFPQSSAIDRSRQTHSHTRPTRVSYLRWKLPRTHLILVLVEYYPLVSRQKFFRVSSCDRSALKRAEQRFQGAKRRGTVAERVWARRERRETLRPSQARAAAILRSHQFDWLFQSDSGCLHQL